MCRKSAYNTWFSKHFKLITESVFILLFPPSHSLGLLVTTPGGSAAGGTTDSGISTSGRHNSLEDINLDQFLKTINYEDTVKQLDIYYGIGNERVQSFK